ncbi:2-oxoglutarate (2OG) and Fe(II)-dependent oxygenase superfamily protein [Klebsormidium nitens]|uniref:2-oxoglutarate (2OG) and Fe(II)-dependent oxygenase superfamily protein n=1 Tax=Klebsormidium nitens TaxID=105231 RepID=A0A1Y1ICR9_KLENI|nr:2-oxoglutarate (2OG) and Fe(II)-dependent oxygenase superfamily protein [Klebsormidium nitens]|eukprot:GAQ86901.1 2-oxoglutarate (2OG) and Fe(II)-dependent oxygenase superfamily protein [Klebsormidium nitens]
MELGVGSKAAFQRKPEDRSRTELLQGGTGDVEWPSIAKKASLGSQLTVLGGGDKLDLFTVQGVFSEAECHRFVEAAETRRFQHQGSRGPKFGEAYRDNGRLAVEDADLAQSIWDSGLGSLLVKLLQIEGKWPSKFNPNVRIYKYEKGQKFGKHVDESVRVDRGLYTGYTLLVYLSGGRTTAPEKEALKGGETVFYGRRGVQVAKVAPETGLALLHVHGDRCLLHEAREVKQGVKYVLRSDVVFE